MLLPIDWLQQFVKIKHSAEELAEIFVSLGFETEEIKNNTLDLEITPNRGDCLSILGLAREYAAKTSQPLRLPDKLDLGQPLSRSKIVRIKFDQPHICLLYCGVIIKNIKLKPSSPEIQTRLRQMQMEPINNLVDITNLIMLETGQPLHAFDLDKIKGAKMTIRTSQTGESLVTLDGKLRQLPPGAIVINDQEMLIDLAGIMGGENSQISKNSLNVLLQSAIFDAKLTRRTSKLLNFTTEASYRYERGVDVENVLPALERASHLVKLEAGGQIAESFALTPPRETSRKAKDLSPGAKTLPPKIRLEISQAEKLIGTPIDRKTALGYLERLGIKREQTAFVPPAWRHDLEQTEDLIEEIIRLYGYDRLKKRLIKKQLFPSHQIYAQTFNRKLALKQYLVSKGLTEIQSYSFISDKEFQTVGATRGAATAPALKPSNPVSADYQYLRPTLLIGMLKTLGQNRWCWKEGLDIFEIGAVFEPQEKIKLALVSYQPQKLEQLNLGLKPQAIETNHPAAKLFKLKNTVWVAEIDWDTIVRIPPAKLKFKSPAQLKDLSVFPPATRDISLIVDRRISAEEVKESILQADRQIVLAELFDEFVSDRLGINKKNLAFHLVMNNPQKTITKTEADKIFDKIVKKMENNFKAELRK